MIFDSRFFHRSGVNGKTYWRLYIRTKNKNEKWKGTERNIERGSSSVLLSFLSVPSFLLLLPAPLLFTLSFRPCLSYLDRSVVKFIVDTVNPSTDLASILPLLHLHFYREEVVCTFHRSSQFFFRPRQV